MKKAFNTVRKIDGKLCVVIPFSVIKKFKTKFKHSSLPVGIGRLEFMTSHQFNKPMIKELSKKDNLKKTTSIKPLKIEHRILK